jgi:hypothetical protein
MFAYIHVKLHEEVEHNVFEHVVTCMRMCVFTYIRVYMYAYVCVYIHTCVLA